MWLISYNIQHATHIILSGCFFMCYIYRNAYFIYLSIMTSASDIKLGPPGLTICKRMEWIWNQVASSLCLRRPQGDMGVCSHRQSQLWHLFSVELIKGQRGPLHRQHVQQTKTPYWNHKKKTSIQFNAAPARATHAEIVKLSFQGDLDKGGNRIISVRISWFTYFLTLQSSVFPSI